MNMVEKFKVLPLWAQLTCLWTVAYILFFKLPGLREIVGAFQAGVENSSAPLIGAAAVQFVFLLVGEGIWLISIYLCGRALLRSRKKGFAFLLAYLMLCTVTTPLAYFSQRYASLGGQEATPAMLAQAGAPALPPSTASPPPGRALTVNQEIKLSLPIGPLLLLLALWHLGKAEETPGEPASRKEPVPNDKLEPSTQ